MMAERTEITKEQLSDTLAAIVATADHDLFALDEATLTAQWYWDWDEAQSVEWNLYTFTGAIELHKRSCRRWEEHHNGNCCVVERVRDKYVMPRVREFALAIESAIAERGKVPELQSMSEAVTDKELQDAMDTWGGYWGCCSDNNVAGSYREAVRLTLEAFAAERGKVPEWQPIETAPEDKLVLLYGGAEHRIEPGRVWHRYERVGSGTYPVFLGNAWTANATRDPATWPTHWMPLPAIPKVTP